MMWRYGQGSLQEEDLSMDDTVTAHSRRTYPDRPIVGVGAVVLDGDRVLLVKRAHAPLKGQWSLPGGAVDVGETLKEAIRREVREETCLNVEVGPIVDVLDRIRCDADGRVEFHYVLVDFLCRPLGGTLRCASDAEDAAWAEHAELGRYGVADLTIEVIDKAIAGRSTAWTSRAVHSE
jgi:8-oxo-dGTP diphosphatase